MLNILRELPLESFIVFLFQSSHVVRDVLAEYVLPVHICVERFRFTVITRESLGTETKLEAQLKLYIFGINIEILMLLNVLYETYNNH